MRAKCICGCRRPGFHMHHVIYQQEIKRHAPTGEKTRWLKDKRNLVPMDFHHHGAHHSGARRLWLSDLPDSVFEFSAELMGAGAAYEYLGRYYRGDDPRLEALLSL